MWVVAVSSTTNRGAVAGPVPTGMLRAAAWLTRHASSRWPRASAHARQLHLPEGRLGRNGAARSASTRVGLFFSSRRRHTRSLRDWSSDVCSSDLAVAHECFANQHSAHAVLSELLDVFAFLNSRSEERRVGKECRCGSSLCHRPRTGGPSRGRCPPGCCVLRPG